MGFTPNSYQTQTHIEVQEGRSKGVKAEAEAEEEGRNTVYSPKLQIVFVY